MIKILIDRIGGELVIWLKLINGSLESNESFDTFSSTDFPSPSFLWRFSGFSLFDICQISKYGKYQNMEKPPNLLSIREGSDYDCSNLANKPIIIFSQLDY